MDQAQHLIPSAPTSIPASAPAPPGGDVPKEPTFHRGVLSALQRMTARSNTIDQSVLRSWLALSPSWLLVDASTCTDPTAGIAVWQLGLHALINVMLALHAQGRLEYDTMNAASRALAECWSISMCWTGMNGAQSAVQGAGGKLKAVLDKDDPTRYRGRVLYPVES